MSTMYDVTTFQFHNDAPSEEQVEACILNAVRQGQYSIDVHWDGRVIELDYHPYRKYFHGKGWIKNVCGDFVAKFLNGKIERGEVVL